MKTRNGFVSNSSSSSFIIGIAKVLDKEKLTEMLKDFSNCKILSKKGVIAYGLSREGYDLEADEYSIVLKAHTNDEEDCVYYHSDDSDDTDYLVVNIGHGEDDGPFSEEGFYGLNYSIVNEQYFKDNFPDSYDLLQLLKGEEGLTEKEAYRYGVSRCG